MPELAGAQNPTWRCPSPSRGCKPCPVREGSGPEMVCAWLLGSDGSEASQVTSGESPWNQRTITTFASNHHRYQVFSKNAIMEFWPLPFISWRHARCVRVESIPYSLLTYYRLSLEASREYTADRSPGGSCFVENLLR